MNTSKLSSILFTLSLILISQASSTKLYEEVCKAAAKNNDRCLQVLKPEPQIVAAEKDLDLCKQILEFAIKKGTEAQNYLKELSKTNPSPAIEECATTHYDEVVGSFKSTLGELKMDPLTASYDAKVAGDGPTTCERALAAANINNPTISALNKDILLLSQIAFLATERLPTPQ